MDTLQNSGFPNSVTFSPPVREEWAVTHTTRGIDKQIVPSANCQDIALSRSEPRSVPGSPKVNGNMIENPLSLETHPEDKTGDASQNKRREPVGTIEMRSSDVTLNREQQAHSTTSTHTTGSLNNSGDCDTSPNRENQATRTRKRIYTRRTKTGCFTCRQRKKKCDEQRPSCKRTLFQSRIRTSLTT